MYDSVDFREKKKSQSEGRQKRKSCTQAKAFHNKVDCNMSQRLCVWAFFRRRKELMRNAESALFLCYNPFMPFSHSIPTWWRSSGQQSVRVKFSMPHVLTCNTDTALVRVCEWTSAVSVTGLFMWAGWCLFFPTSAGDISMSHSFKRFRKGEKRRRNTFFFFFCRLAQEEWILSPQVFEYVHPTDVWYCRFGTTFNVISCTQVNFFVGAAKQLTVGHSNSYPQ